MLSQLSAWMTAHPLVHRLLTLALAALGAALGVSQQVSSNRATAVTPPGSTAPATMPPAPQQPNPQPLAAIGQIQFGHAGCSATIIWPRRPDGSWDILTANHCIDGQPRNGVMILRDGRRFEIKAIVGDKKSDHYWLQTVSTTLDLPYAILSERLPEPGEQVWHAGFGIDNPGNRESGQCLQGDTGTGQSKYRLSVSSGDSGGGIALTASGRVLSPVCCTTRRGGVGDVWGATCLSCAADRPAPAVVSVTWTPIEVPLLSTNN